MHKELEVMKPRCNGLWKRCAGTAAFVYFWMLANVPTVAFAADKGKSNATDTGVTEVTNGINVIKDLVLGCVGGVGNDAVVLTGNTADEVRTVNTAGGGAALDDAGG